MKFYCSKYSIVQTHTHSMRVYTSIHKCLWNKILSCYLTGIAHILLWLINASQQDTNKKVTRSWRERKEDRDKHADIWFAEKNLHAYDGPNIVHNSSGIAYVLHWRMQRGWHFSPVFYKLRPALVSRSVSWHLRVVSTDFVERWHKKCHQLERFVWRMRPDCPTISRKWTTEDTDVPF